ncbi:MAG: Gfo/Idh/MocA family protein [Thermomicrobiales bacterium]
MPEPKPLSPQSSVLSPIRLGLIGCGRISHQHMRALRELPTVVVAGVADVSEENIAALTDAFPELKDAEAYHDYREMLTTNLDGVIIMTPHGLHYQHIKESLAAGKHVLSEKPFVTQPEQARELIALAEAHKRILMVSYQNPRLWPYRYAHQQIAAGNLGDILFYSGQITQQWGAFGGWRLSSTLSEGGMLVDTGSHFVDIMLYLTGMKPEVVAAFNDADGAQVDIINGAVIRFNGGRVATLAAVGRGPTLWNITIVGTKGTIEIWDRDNIRHIGADNYAGWIGTPRTNLVPPEGKRPTSTTPQAEFVAAVAKNDLSASDADRGLAVAQVTQAIYASAREGGMPVQVTSTE